MTVKDTAGLTDSDSVHITVNHVTPPQPVDKRPVANAGHPGPDQNVNEGSLVTLNGSASTDPDIGDTLTYSWTQTAGPSVTLSNPTSAMTTFTAPPPGSTNIAELTFQLTVKDTAGLTDSDSVHITVNHVTPPQPVDKRPVANAGHPGPDQNVNEGSIVTLDGSASY